MRTLFILLVFFGSLPSFSQENLEELSLEDLLDVKVSVATLFDESEFEVPSTVASFSSSVDMRMGALQATDYFFTTEGVQLYSGFNGGRQLSIRGFTSASTATNTAFLLDGVSLNRFDSGGALNVLNLTAFPFFKKVELIKGPGSTLYGGNAFLGTMSSKTYGVENSEWIVEANAASNSYNDFKLLSPGLKWRRSRFFVGYGHLIRGDQGEKYQYVDPDTSTKESAKRRRSFASHQLKLESDISLNKDHFLKISYLGEHKRYSEGMGVGTALSSGQSKLKEMDTTNLNAMRFSLYKAELRSVLSSNLSGNVSAYYSDLFVDSDLYVPLGGATIGQNYITYKEKKFGFNGHLKAELPTDTRLVLGVDYKNQKIPEGYSKTFLANSDTLLTEGNRSTVGSKRAVLGVYLQGKQKLYYRPLSLHLGGRYDNYSSVGGHFSPRAALVWAEKGNRAKSVKLVYGNSFRPPTADDLSGSVGIAAAPNVKAETIDTYELFYGKRLNDFQFSNTLFHSLRRDMILIRGSAKNLGNSRSYGLESSLKYNNGVSDYKVAGSYVRSRSDGESYYYNGFPLLILTGEVGHKLESIGVKSFLMARYTQDWTVSFAEDNGGALKPFLQIDGALKKTMKGYDLWLKAKNILGRKNNTPTLIGAQYGMPAVGRTVSLGVESRF